MEPLHIEDTDDWLGTPAPIETCQHQLRMYENEFEALSLQLSRALENVRGLVQSNDEITQDRDSLRAQLTAAKAETADASRRATEAETKATWELMAKNKHISELARRLEAATGISVRTGQPIR